MNNKLKSKNVATIVACFTKRVMMIAIIVVTMSFAVNAQNERPAFQQGDFAVGGHLAVFPESGFPTFGIGAKVRYNVTDPIRIEGAFTGFVPITESVLIVERTVNLWDLSFNVHYLFAVSEIITMYPLAGLSVLGLSQNVSVAGISANTSDTELFLNLGGGMDIKLNYHLSINLEPRLILGARDNIGNSFMISAGVMYRF